MLHTTNVIIFIRVSGVNFKSTVFVSCKRYDTIASSYGIRQKENSRLYLSYNEQSRLNYVSRHVPFLTFVAL
jgi:hypothetical protein